MSVCDDKILKLKERIDSDLPIYSKAQVKRVREITVSSSLKRKIPEDLSQNKFSVRLFKKDQPKPALRKVFEDQTAAAIRERQQTLERPNHKNSQELPARPNGPRLVWGKPEIAESHPLASGWGKEVLESQKKRSNQVVQSAMENLNLAHQSEKENKCIQAPRKESVMSKNNLNTEREPLATHNQSKQVHSIILINLNQQIARRIRLTQGAKHRHPTQELSETTRKPAQLLPQSHPRRKRRARIIH